MAGPEHDVGRVVVVEGWGRLGMAQLLPVLPTMSAVIFPFGVFREVFGSKVAVSGAIVLPRQP